MLADSEETHDCATWGAPINFINEEQVPVAPEPKSKDASCQADLFIAPKETRTIGTQTSFKNHRRSKGKAVLQNSLPSATIVNWSCIFITNKKCSYRVDLFRTTSVVINKSPVHLYCPNYFLVCQRLNKFTLHLGIQVKVKSKDASVQALRKSSTPVTSTPKKHRLEESFEMSEVESELESSYVALESKIEYDEPAM